MLDTGGATATRRVLVHRPLRPRTQLLRRRSSTPSPATSTSPRTAPTSWSRRPARSPAARAAAPCATPSRGGRPTAPATTRPGSTTPAATRPTASRSPAARSTSAATCAGRTTPSRATRPGPVPWPARASRRSTRSTACRCRGTRAAPAASAPRHSSPPAQGLWVGSDTTRIGGETHGRIAFMPLAGGTTIPSVATPPCPTTSSSPSAPPAPASNVLYRVDAAGPALQATGRRTRLDDRRRIRQRRQRRRLGHHRAPRRHRPGQHPADIFAAERCGQQDWNFPVPAGRHVTVRLYFANQYDGTSQAGQRVFDVLIDDTAVLSNFDIVAAAGNKTGTMRVLRDHQRRRRGRHRPPRDHREPAHQRHRDHRRRRPDGRQHHRRPAASRRRRERRPTGSPVDGQHGDGLVDRPRRLPGQRHALLRPQRRQPLQADLQQDHRVPSAPSRRSTCTTTPTTATASRSRSPT